MSLTSYHDWEHKCYQENANQDNVGKDALQSYDTGIDNDITLEAEDENGMYNAYIQQMNVRLKKHKSAYEDHLKGSLPTEAFVKDIEITKRLIDDFTAYMDRFVKLSSVKGKKIDK